MLYLPIKINDDTLPSSRGIDCLELYFGQENGEKIEFAAHFAGNDDFVKSCATLLALSTTHGRCVNDKRGFFMGDGVNFIGTDSETKKAASIFDAANFSSTGLQVIERAATDYFAAGIAYVKIQKVTVGNTTRFFMSHLDASKCRISRKKNGISYYVGYSENWKVSSEYNKDTHELHGKFPFWLGSNGSIILDEAEAKNASTVVVISNYTIGNNYYPYPMWLPAAKNIATEIAMADMELEEIENGLMPNTLIQGVNQNSQEDRKTVQEYITKRWSRKYKGSDKSQIIVQFVNNAESLLDIKNIPKPPLSDNIPLSDALCARIIIAHGLTPSIVGVNLPGKLSNSSEILAELEMAMTKIIVPAQNLFLPVLNKFLELNSIDAKIEFSNNAPISFRSLIKPSEVLTINEQRAELGYTPISDGDKLIQPKTNAATNNN